MLALLRPLAPRLPSLSLPSVFTRNRGQLAPKNMQNIKRHKGRVPIPTGGSVKGTTLAYGEWGLRIKGQGVRFTAKQLTGAEEVIKRKIKVIKGAKVYLRVFPDIPVCVKVRTGFLFALLRRLMNANHREMKRVWVKERVHSNTGLHGASARPGELSLPSPSLFFQQ